MKRLFLWLLLPVVVPIVGVVVFDHMRDQSEAPVVTDRSAQRPLVLSEPVAQAPSDEPANDAPVSPPATDRDAGESAAATSAADPVPVAASIARLVDAKHPLSVGMEIPRLHAQLEAEPKDLVRAPQLEYDIRNYLQSTASNAYSIDLIECRTTLCELQVTASQSDAKTAWSNALAAMRQQPWAAVIASTVHAVQEDDVTRSVGVVTILRLQTTQQ
jgi:hypothetical protein